MSLFVSRASPSRDSEEGDDDDHDEDDDEGQQMAMMMITIASPGMSDGLFSHENFSVGDNFDFAILLSNRKHKHAWESPLILPVQDIFNLNVFVCEAKTTGDRREVGIFLQIHCRNTFANDTTMDRFGTSNEDRV